jgi:hypothetical protein
MSKYKIYTSIELKVIITIDADSEEDALNKAENLNESNLLKGEINDISTIDFIKVHRAT